MENLKEEERIGQMALSLARESIGLHKLESARKNTLLKMSLGFNALIVAIFMSSVLYFFNAYSVETESTSTTTTTYEQTSDGDSSIINGDQYRDNSQNNKAK